MAKYLKKKIKDERGIYIHVYGKNKSELDAKIKARQEEIAHLRMLETNPLVHQYAKKWYAVATQHLSDSRRSDYALAINKHICPHIGNLHMAEVSESDIVVQ